MAALAAKELYTWLRQQATQLFKADRPSHVTVSVGAGQGIPVSVAGSDQDVQNAQKRLEKCSRVAQARISRRTRCRMAFGARGLFSCNSITIHINTDRIVAYGAYAKRLERSCRARWDSEPVLEQGPRRQSMSEVERTSVLTLAHEQDHFRLLVGTPVGLLMWRCNETLVADVAFAMRALAALGLKQLPGKQKPAPMVQERCGPIPWFRPGRLRRAGEASSRGSSQHRPTLERVQGCHVRRGSPYKHHCRRIPRSREPSLSLILRERWAPASSRLACEAFGSRRPDLSPSRR